ncbi:MAG: DMT family transporter [Halodesulfurarchaeum sp.]
MTLSDFLRGPRGTVGMFLLLAVLWGTSFVAIEVGLHEFPPLSFAGIRYLAAGTLIMGLAVMSATVILPRNRTDLTLIAIVAVFMIFANHAFLYLGEQIVSGAVASIVLSLSPVLTLVFASLALEQGFPRAHESIGFVLGLVGVVIIAQPDPGSLDVAHLKGIGLVLLAAASFAAGGVLSRRVRSGLPIESIQGWAMLGGSVILLGAGQLRGESLTALEITRTGWLSLGYLILFSGILAYLIYFTLLDRVGPSHLNLVGYLEPMTAALVAWLLLGQAITQTMIAGFVLIMLGFTAIRRDLVVKILDAPYARVLETGREIVSTVAERRITRGDPSLSKGGRDR